MAASRPAPRKRLFKLHPESVDGQENGMRIAVVSDIHGNLTAFEAVLADIKQVSPDLVVHGGDLALGGSSPIEIIDAIRGFGWQGVMGNADEVLVRPDSLEEFAHEPSDQTDLWAAIRQMASATRSIVGDERLAWLRGLPMAMTQTEFALIHATPQSCWKAPAASASDAEIEAIYGTLDRPIVVFGHTHYPAIRKLNGRLKLLINTGSVGLPYDGNPRASYLLLDGNNPSIRRVEYNVEKELKALSACGLPQAAWTAKMLRASAPQVP
jgi:putative phosphoesterase